MFKLYYSPNEHYQIVYCYMRHYTYIELIVDIAMNNTMNNS